jgi:hypothetical protein
LFVESVTMMRTCWVATALAGLALATANVQRVEGAIIVDESIVVGAQTGSLPEQAPSSNRHGEIPELIAGTGTDCGWSGTESDSLRVLTAVPGLFSPRGIAIHGPSIVDGLAQAESKNIRNPGLDGLLEPPKHGNDSSVRVI